MDAIHILNTGKSDCIILESEGQFAMIDAAEDNDNPRGFRSLAFRGYEQEITNWVLSHCRGQDGKATFAFLLGTHAHSDHLGGFDTLLANPDIVFQKAYLKPYTAKGIFPMEVHFWDNREVYEQTVQALREREVPIVEQFDGEQVRLGNFRLTFLNAEDRRYRLRHGENCHSVVTLVEKDGTRALLVGDLNYKSGGEKRIMQKLGKVNLLKVGHHGTVGSTSAAFAKAMSPEIAVVTNTRSGAFPDVKLTLKRVGAKVYYTADCGGVTVLVDGGGKLTVKTGIMP